MTLDEFSYPAAVRREMADDVFDLLAAAGLPGHALTVEPTESLALTFECEADAALARMICDVHGTWWPEFGMIVVPTSFDLEALGEALGSPPDARDLWWVHSADPAVLGKAVNLLQAT
jgi:hypothetical protein